MNDADSNLDLLLTDAEEFVPVLADGLPIDDLSQAPPPSRGPKGAQSPHLDDPSRDPNDLPAQRWGVIAPEGERGNALIDAIEELITHRQQQQGAAPKIYRVPPDMDSVAAMRWKHEVYRAESVPEDERPRYLMVLGDLHEVSLDLQHILSNGSLVGRLHCQETTGFRNYAQKVVARETGELAEKARSLYYTVQDGTSAVSTGYSRLMEPCFELTHKWQEAGKIDIESNIEIPFNDWGPDEMLDEAGADIPSVMLSLSHGLGAPRRGWKTPDHQRALQGAISMGMEEPLTADALRETPFLPGGIWMAVACFAAGTPATSAFYPWLSLLAEHGGNPQQAKMVLKSLPTADQRPFVAALPQALLANPNGPLAIIGHMDLAWTFGFTDPTSKKSRASRMFSTLRAALAGGRVGVALDALMRIYRDSNDDLMTQYQLQREAQARGDSGTIDPKLLGCMWMQRNDLRGYVLLGDPAARLHIQCDNPAVFARPKTPRSTPKIETKPPATQLDRTNEAVPAQAPEAKPAAASPGNPVYVQQAPQPNVQPAIEPPTTAHPNDRGAAPGATPSEHSVPQSPPSQGPATAPRHDPPAQAPPAPPASHLYPPQPYRPHPGPSVTHNPATHPSLHPATMANNNPSAPPTPPPPEFAQAPQAPPQSTPPPMGAAPLPAMTRPRSLENPQVALRERAVLALIRGDEAPRSIAVRFGIPLEELFYWLDVYRESGRRVLGG